MCNSILRRIVVRVFRLERDGPVAGLTELAGRQGG